MLALWGFAAGGLEGKVVFEVELAGQSSRLGLWNDLRNRMTSGRLAQPVLNLDD